jgi:hypothetical protein
MKLESSYFDVSADFMKRQGSGTRARERARGCAYTLNFAHNLQQQDGLLRKSELIGL